MNDLGFQELKVVALAVNDMARARHFYQATLDLPSATLGGESGFTLGNLTLMLKLAGNDWPARPSRDLNPRLTIAVDDAPNTERLLTARGVTVSDPVQLYEEGKYYVGAFIDSEGNRLWFCSART